MDGSRNILTIEIGAFGLRTGQALRETMLKEHWIDYGGKFNDSIVERTASSVYGNNYDNDKFIEHADVYFREEQDPKNKETKYIPRCILIDEGTSDIERILKEQSSNSLWSDSIIYSNDCSLKNSFKYPYEMRNENLFLALAYENVLKEMEKWDRQPAIQLIFSLEGGFGPGFFKFFANCILNDCSSTELIVHLLYPDVSSGVYPCGLGLYNWVEGMSHLIELTELTFMYDNQGLSNISNLLYPQDYFNKKGMKGYELEWVQNNQVIVDYISDITSASRFPLYSSWWYKKLATNMVQFPRLHFLSGFLSPLNCKSKRSETWEFDNCTSAEKLFKNLHEYNLQ